MGFQVSEHIVKAAHLVIVRLGHWTGKLATKSRDQLQEIHRIDIAFVAQIGGRIDRGNVDFGGDATQMLDQEYREGQIGS